MFENLSGSARETTLLMREEKLKLFGPRSYSSGFQLVRDDNTRRTELGSIVSGDMVSEMLQSGLLEEINPLPKGESSINVYYRLSTGVADLPTARTDAHGDFMS